MTDATGVQALTEGEYEEQLEDLRTRTEVAISQGNSRKANRLYAEQQALIESHEGSGPIVGSSQRFA